MGLAMLSHTDCARRAPPKGFRKTSSACGRSLCFCNVLRSAAAQSAAPSPFWLQPGILSESLTLSDAECLSCALASLA